MRPSIAPGRSATSVTAHNDSAWASLTSKQANLWPQEFLKSEELSLPKDRLLPESTTSSTPSAASAEILGDGSAPDSLVLAPVGS